MRVFYKNGGKKIPCKLIEATGTVALIEHKGSRYTVSKSRLIEGIDFGEYKSLAIATNHKLSNAAKDLAAISARFGRGADFDSEERPELGHYQAMLQALAQIVSTASSEEYEMTGQIMIAQGKRILQNMV